MPFIPAEVLTAATASPDLSRDSAGGHTILDLYQQKSDAGIVINIVADGKFGSFEQNCLKDPPRLVLDLPGIIFPGAPEAFKCSDPDNLMKRIRINTSNPGRTRLVFDMSGTACIPYDITRHDNTLRIEFFTKKAKSSTPVAKITAPQGDISVQEGSYVYFSGTASGGNAPVACTWTITGNALNHAAAGIDTYQFDRPGIYRVTYRAVDRDGEAADDSVTITVKDKYGNIPSSDSSGSIWPVRNFPSGTSLFFGAGIYRPGAAGDFTIVRSGSLGDEIFSLSGENRHLLTIGAGCPIASWLSLEMSLAGIPDDKDMSLFLVSAGPKIRLAVDESLGPYARAAITYGQFGWKDAPGDFDDSFGVELGYGFSYRTGCWDVGLDLSYRRIFFDYRAPDDPLVRTSSDRIILSGQGISLSAAYRF